MHLETIPVLPFSSNSWSMHLTSDTSTCALWNYGKRRWTGEMLIGALAHWISCFQSILLRSLSSFSAQTGNSDAYKFRPNSMLFKEIINICQCHRIGKRAKSPESRVRQPLRRKEEKPTLSALLSWIVGTPPTKDLWVKRLEAHKNYASEGQEFGVFIHWLLSSSSGGMSTGV